MMELPLNSEICEPLDSSSIELGQNERSIRVRGYALGAKGMLLQNSQHAKQSAHDTFTR